MGLIMKADDILITNNDPERFDFCHTLYWNFKPVKRIEKGRIDGELSTLENAKLIRTFKNKFKLEMGEYEVTSREPQNFKSFTKMSYLKLYAKQYLKINL